MSKRLTIILGILILGSLLLAACGGGGGEVSEEVPEQYASMTNPFAGNADAATAGQEIYTTNCTSCHGTSGKADGPAAAGLDPKPADLSVAVAEADATDGLLFYHVAEGAAAGPSGSAMPAWKGVLSDDQIWQVITYIRNFK